MSASCKVRKFSLLPMIYIFLFAVFSSENVDASKDINELLLDDKLNPSNLPLCSDKPFRLCVGHLKYSNADYVGALKNNVPNGYGTLTFSSGEYVGRNYLGQFKNGKKHGQGKTSWPNGYSYTGSYRDGNMEGLGTVIWPNGSQYTGHFLDNKQHGQGKYTHPNGSTREGTFVNGNFHFGVERTSSGSIREGTFVDEKLHDGFLRLSPSDGNPEESIVNTSITGFTPFFFSLLDKLRYLVVGDEVEIKNGKAESNFVTGILFFLAFLCLCIILMILFAKFNLNRLTCGLLFTGMILLDLTLPGILENLSKPSDWIFPLLLIILIFFGIPLRRRKKNVCPKCGARPHFFGLGEFEEVQIEVDNIPHPQTLTYSVCPMCRHKWQSSGWNSIELRGTS